MRNRATPTLHDVAARAGVSISTASRVVNGKAHVTEEKRARVEAAMRELDYVSNISARTLRSGSSRTWALLVDDFASPLFSRLADTLTRIALETGHTLLVTTTQKDHDREMAAISAMLARNVDGLFVVTSRGQKPVRKSTGSRYVPVVYIERIPDEADVDVVTFDYYRVGRGLIDRLLDDGHTRIAFLGGDVGEDPGIRRLHAYRDGLRARGLEPDPALISTGHVAEGTVAPELGRMAVLPQPPTAVITTVAPILRAVLRAHREHPAPLDIAGYESIDTPEITPHTLHLVDGDVEELAHGAVRLMGERADDPARAPQSLVIDPPFRTYLPR